MVYADIRRGSQARGLQMRVGSSKMVIFAYFARHIFRTFTSKAAVIIRPPGTMSSGRAYVFAADVSSSSFFVSPLVLRAPSTDRPETLPRSRNLAEFYNPTPKIWGALPQKNLGAKNMQNFGQFWTTSDFGREYLRNG